MLDQIFLAANSWVQEGAGYAALGFFVWGLISVILSPCNVASVPILIGFVAGQEKAINPRQGVFYALSFTSGVFVTIAILGVVCSLLGHMLGEISPYWTILVGIVLLWTSIDMLGVVHCSLPTRLCRIKIRGLPGAFCLGLAYGILSGTCTFGFIAPILAVITIQKKFLTGVFFILLFGFGQSIPIAIAGISVATMRKFIESRPFCKGGIWIRRFAGLGIGLVGIYFILLPFTGSS